NPNALGTISAVIFAVIFSSILPNENGTNSKKKKLLIFAVLLFSIYFVILSGSRTSLLAVLITIMAWVGIYTIYLIKYKKLLKVLKTISALVILIVPIMFIISKIKFLNELVYVHIISKFQESIKND